MMATGGAFPSLSEPPQLPSSPPQPLPPEDWNAPELSYRVQWRPAGDGGLWAEAMVTAPPVVVTPTPTFTPYDLRLQALNPAGKGPETPPTLGYSGEDGKHLGRRGWDPMCGCMWDPGIWVLYIYTHTRAHIGNLEVQEMHIDMHTH